MTHAATKLLYPGKACQERAKHRDSWRVVARRFNRISFYQISSAGYSEVYCLECKAYWRTQGNFIDDIPDFKGDW